MFKLYILHTLSKDGTRTRVSSSTWKPSIEVLSSLFASIIFFWSSRSYIWNVSLSAADSRTTSILIHTVYQNLQQRLYSLIYSYISFVSVCSGQSLISSVISCASGCTRQQKLQLIFSVILYASVFNRQPAIHIHCHRECLTRCFFLLKFDVVIKILVICSTGLDSNLVFLVWYVWNVSLYKTYTYFIFSTYFNTDILTV